MASNLPKAMRIEAMRRAWALAISGMPQSRIAEELGVSQPQVSRYLAAVGRSAADRLAEDAAVYAVLSLNQADRVLWEALQAFERSTRPRRKATKKTSPDGSTRAGTPGGGEGQTTTEVTEREGDPAWLAEARAAIRLRHELLDRFAPPARPAESRTTDGAATVADALLEAERRDEAYQCQTPTPADGSPSPSSP